MTRVRDVHVDFETFSEAKIGRSPKAVGSHRYAEDPSTEVLCLAYAFDDDDPKLWTPAMPEPEDLFDAIEDGALVHAWNAEFEISVWREVCVRRMGWVRVPFRSWRDTAADAMAHALPWKLDGTLKALGLPLKDPRGDRLVQKLCQPRRPSKLNPATRWTPETAPADFHGLYEYCMTDVDVERSVASRLPGPLSPSELWIWRETVRMNLRGWAVDLDSVERMRAVLQEHREGLLEELSEITDGEVTSDKQRDRALDWLAERGVDLPDYTADTIKEAVRRDDLPKDARRFLEIRQSLGKTSVKKYDAISLKASSDGTIKNNIAYHGATTGRDAGRGVQVQNFVRKNVTKEEDDQEKISAAIETGIGALRCDDPLDAIEIMYGEPTDFASVMCRPMLVARPGHVLYAADLSQIENRVAVWLAECSFGIEVYRKGLDEYRTFASRFYDVEYDEVTGDQRQHCKHAVLGCVFGMGWMGYVAQAERFGQTCEESEARETVDAYRDTYSEVVKLWHGLNKAAKKCVRSGAPTRYKKIRFEIDDEFDFLFMVVPSGRRIAYPKPRIQLVRTPWGEKRPAVTHMGMSKATFKWERLHVTPGRWCENAVQATARDVMMEGARKAVRAGYHQVGRVHDELVTERPKGEGDLEEFESFLSNPTWLPGPDDDPEFGIPVEAKGWVGERYRK